MNIKYYHDFIGSDDVLNRFEILTAKNVQAAKIEATTSPFSLQYLDVKKLEPIQGSQCTLGLISETSFHFIDLHTDNMQEYMIRFYRDNKLYWLGYLDSELYNENLTDYPPYPVEFSGADFNIMERLKFRDVNDKPYTDIATLLTQIKRCLDKLRLPFGRLYIGCSTIPVEITLAATETALHRLYVQSSNFYDEDAEPMSCREVTESILQPFGLMMVQRDGCVYIYDYNTIKAGGVMKCYNFSTLAYIGDTAVDTMLGDISDIGTRSTTASLGFEEMINNVEITSSLYAVDTSVDAKIEESKLSEIITTPIPMSGRTFYNKSEQVENINGKFALYRGSSPSIAIGDEEVILGCYANYNPLENNISPMYRVKYPNYLTKVDRPSGRVIAPFYLNLKISAYPSTTSQPVTQEGLENVPNSGVLKLYCNLYMIDTSGRVVAYYNLTPENGETKGWNAVPDGIMKQGRLVLWFCGENSDNTILDSWTSNANNVAPADKPSNSNMQSSLVGKGLFIIPEISGHMVFEITNKNIILNPVSGNTVEASKIKMLLYDNIGISLVDALGESLSSEDYEFKSYINKNVASNYDNITLKCISANEEKAPIGRANLLKRDRNNYELQLSYTRAGATEILERLLMSTIHSNFATKNKVISVDIKMTDNPALRCVTYDNVLKSDGMYITGATLDFHEAVTKIQAVDIHADTFTLSDIPYN